MKRIADLPIWIIGSLGLIVAVWQAMEFLKARDPQSGIPDLMAGTSHLLWAIGGLVVTIVCVVAYFVRHPRVEEEIHISR